MNSNTYAQFKKHCTSYTLYWLHLYEKLIYDRKQNSRTMMISRKKWKCTKGKTARWHKSIVGQYKEGKYLPCGYKGINPNPRTHLQNARHDDAQSSPQHWKNWGRNWVGWLDSLTYLLSSWAIINNLKRDKRNVWGTTETILWHAHTRICTFRKKNC